MRGYQIVKEQMPASPPQSSYVRAQEEDQLVLLIKRPWPLTVHAKKRYSFRIGVLNNLPGPNCPKCLCHKNLTSFRFIGLLRLGSFRFFVFHRSAAAEIGFVSYFCRAGIGFVSYFLGAARWWGRGKLGSFRVFGAWAGCTPHK